MRAQFDGVDAYSLVALCPTLIYQLVALQDEKFSGQMPRPQVLAPKPVFGFIQKSSA